MKTVARVFAMCMGAWMAVEVGEAANPVLFQEGFEGDLSHWQLVSNGGSISLSHARTYLSAKSLLLDYTVSSGYLHLKKGITPSTHVLLRVFFCDDGASALGTLVQLALQIHRWRSFRSIVSDLPPRRVLRMISEDARRPDLLHTEPSSGAWRTFTTRSSPGLESPPRTRKSR